MSRRSLVKMMSSDCLRLLVVLLVVAVLREPGLAQGSAGSGGKFEPRALVDMPTAGMLDKGSFALDIGFYQEGGTLIGFSVGVLDRLGIGVSYGGSKLIGSATPVMNDIPEINLKVRLLEESIFVPALAIGFDSQGKDGYIKDLNRYVVK